MGKIRHHCHCPYCNHGEGAIGVDLDAAGAWLTQNVESTFFISAHPGQRVVVFNPDRANGRQCFHIIGGSINIVFQKVSPDRIVQAEGELIAELTHAWFRDHDIDHGLDGFLWEIISHDPELHYKPTTPYHVKWMDHEYDEVAPDGSSLHFRLFGKMIMARDPGQFLEELKLNAETPDV